MTPALLLALALTGCSSKDGDSDAYIEASSIYDGELYDTGFWDQPRATSKPQWTAEEVVEIAENWIREYNFPFPHDVFEEYSLGLSYRDEDCPSDNGDMSLIIPLSGCTTDAGYTYTGITFAIETDEWVDALEVRKVQIGYALADFVFIDLEGERFVGGGWCDAIWYGDEVDKFVWGYMRLTGSWSYPNARAAWLRGGVSASIVVENYTQSSGNIRLMGSLNVADYALYFRGLEFDREECIDEAVDGQLWVRQDDGSWNQIVFAGACGGCAEVYWNKTEYLGEVCPDLSGLSSEIRRRSQEPPTWSNEAL